MLFENVFYNVSKFCLKLFFRLFYRMDIKGLEDVPLQGGVILCANHVGLLDPFSIGCWIRRKVYYMAKEELFRSKFIAYFLKILCAFPIKRDKVDIESVKNSLKILKRGDMLGIYPEGTRNKSGGKLRPKPGVAMFAIKGNVPVIPVAISGSYKLFSRITIRYGKPFRLNYEDKKYTNEELIDISSEIMDRIEKLLEEQF